MRGEPDPAQLERLTDAARNLPRLQRQVFLAHRLEGRGYGEIALRLGLSARRVERQMARAVCNIDRQLGGVRLRWWHRWL
jgi:RNA polymerase sigma-70 factor (ECF subfamily)